MELTQETPTDGKTHLSPAAQTEKAAGDRELFRAVQEGDQTAFRNLVERYKDRLFNVVVRLLADREEALDVVQETFLRVFQHRERYNPAFSLSTWIYTIALNLARNELRRRKKMKFLDIFELTQSDGNVRWLLPAPGGRYGPAWGWKHALEAAVAHLPVKYRTCFLLRDVDGWSHEEIAQMLAVPVGTVKSRVNRAHHLLQKELQPKLEGIHALSHGTSLPVELR